MASYRAHKIYPEIVVNLVVKTPMLKTQIGDHKAIKVL